MDFKKLNFFGLPFMTWREYLLSHCNFDWQITKRIDLQEDPEPAVFFKAQYFKRDLMYTEEIEYDVKRKIVCWNEENPAVILDFEDPVSFYLI